MGIHDREYARPSGQRFGGGMHQHKKITVTTWLIISCVGIFVIGGFLPKSPVPITRTIHQENTSSKLTEGSTQIRYSPIQNHDSRVQLYNFEEYVDGTLVSTGQALNMNSMEQLLHFSTNTAVYGIHYWRFIGFQFLHASPMHLIFNMIGLFFFGPMVERYLGGKRYLAFYLLCGIFGAVLYLILNLGGFVIKDVFEITAKVPGLLITDTLTPLVGASAGVFGILLAGAFLAPNVRVLVFFIIPMRLSTMAYVLVGLALVTVIFGGNNAGGEAAHLGGAAAGWYFIRHPHHLNGFFDFLGKADPTSEHFAWRDRGAKQEDIDRILDKIHNKGLQSLSSKEKKILHNASKERREDT
jgi:membrane associated rhomboid family serine protease